MLDFKAYDWTFSALTDIQNKLFESEVVDVENFIDSSFSGKTIILYGASQIGKTTLLLNLFGVKPDSSFDGTSLNEILRGGEPAGHSSTSTVILYQKSNDDTFKINGEKYCAAQAIIEKLKEIRRNVEKNSEEKKILEISFPNHFFEDSCFLETDDFNSIRILDMPGVGSTNEKEYAHVEELYKQYLMVANAVCVVVPAENIQSLQTIKSSNILPSLWYQNDNYFIFTTKSLSGESIFKEVKNSLERGENIDFIKEIFEEKICNEVLDNTVKEKIFTFDVGNSFESKLNELKKAQISTEEFKEFNNKMKKDFFEKMKKISGNRVLGIINFLKDLIEKEMNNAIEKITKEIEKCENDKKTKEKMKSNSEKVEKNLEEECDYFKQKKDELLKEKDSFVNIAMTADDFSKKMKKDEKLVEKYRKYTKSFFFPKKKYNEYLQALRGSISITIDEKIDEILKKLLDDNDKEKVTFWFKEKDNLKVIINKIEVNEFSEKSLKNLWKNEILDRYKTDFEKYIDTEVREVEEKLAEKEKEICQKKNFTDKLNSKIQEYEIRIDNLNIEKNQKQKEKEHKVAILQNYLEISKYHYEEKQKKIINEINISTQKYDKVKLFLFYALNQRTYEKIKIEGNGV